MVVRYAHIASVLWYLAFECYQPATKLSKGHYIYLESHTNTAAVAWKSIKDLSDKSDME